VGYGVKLRVWGEWALFTRPEMKVERVSYDTLTPSAARGILEAILYKPALSWRVRRIHVLNQIKFGNIRRNEVENKIKARNVLTAIKNGKGELAQYATDERQQRAAILLRDVDYVIEADFVLTDKVGERDSPEKFYCMFSRRARQGQCFHQPYFGCREFAVNFSLLEEEAPTGYYSAVKELDLGWMLLDMDFSQGPAVPQPRFFRAALKNGVINVPPLWREDVSG
jgi:CRISPR-associated protein Cas5d